MAIVINGSGTVTGLAVGGLPDGTVDAGTLATNSVTAAKLEVSAITSADLPAGSVLQVVYGTYSTAVTLSSTSYADSGLSLSITPKFSTSKIYIIVNQQSSIQSSAGGTDAGFGLRLLRDSTVVFSSATTYDIYLYFANTADVLNTRGRTSLNYLDSPATTSTITYKTQGATYTTSNSNVSFQNASNPSNITLMEIAG